MPSEVDASKKTYVLHFLDEAGRYEVLIPTIDNEFIEFTTTSFSTFVIVNEKEQETSSSNNSGNDNTTDSTTNNSNNGLIKSPKTYDISYDEQSVDNSKLMVAYCIFVFASIGFIFSFKEI